mgnify:CR=1 FL=1
MDNYGTLIAKGVTFKDNEASTGLCLPRQQRGARIRERSLGAPLASHRTAQYGGAISANGPLLLIDCVFTGNSASSDVSHPTAARLPRSPPALRSLAGR